MSQGASPLPKDKGPTTDPGKAVGTKRLQSDTPGPGNQCHQVYVRRKVESEHNKVNCSLELKGNGKVKTEEQEARQDAQHEDANKPQVTSPVSESVEIELASSKSHEETNEEIIHEKTEPPVASSAGINNDFQQSSIQYWNERFSRLQTYLENCDRSTQEVYLRKLRSLSAVGRSMHAIELEKRAIHLLVEEGKELQLMKALNVLGKVSLNVSSKHTPLQQREFQK